MTEWRFSDGTVVRLGGDAEGDSAFADELRHDVALVRAGMTLPVSVYVEPGGSVPLDVDEPYLVHRWLRDAARCHGVEMTGAPEPEPAAPPDPRGNLGEFDPSKIY